MRKTSPLALCIALAVLSVAGLAEQSPAPPAPSAKAEAPAPAGQTAEEADFLALANAERRQRGLPALSHAPLLMEVARQHSREMCEKAYFGHRSPAAGRKTPLDRYLRGGGTYDRRVVVGENLYYCLRASVERGHAAFMRSPGHRRNIVSAEWEQMGVGIHRAPDGRFWVTEMFLRKD